MTALDIVLAALGVTVALLVGRLALGAAWRGIGAYRQWRAGPRYLLARHHRIWQAPDSTHADPVHGPGNPAQSPTPPFRFIEEHTSGSQPCISVRDMRGHRWRVKWGGEVHSETFAVRVAWACGYFSEVTYFVKSGEIQGASDLRRARDCVEPDGTFCDARFELDDPDVRKLFEEHSWAWDDNPFIGTRELNGLKMVVMLLSNWDTKDRRDVARGSNTAIFEQRRSGWSREARYLLTDWGGSMGKWGSNIATRGRWDPAGFEQQTPQYVTGVKDGFVQFGYVGQRTADIARNIAISDVRWFAPYLSRLDETFLQRSLLASGASADEATRFTHALLTRIRQLKDLISTDDGI